MSMLCYFRAGVPGGPPPREPYQASKKLQQTQAQVDDVSPGLASNPCESLL